MLNVLHRSVDESVILDRPIRYEEPPSLTPPKEPPAAPEPTPRWPFGAKVLVAVLAVLALAGAIGTFVGPGGSDDSTTGELQASVNDLSSERDLLRAARDEAVERIASLEATLASVEAERDDALARIDELEATNEALVGEVAELDLRVVELENSVTSLMRSREVLSNELAAAHEAIDGLEAGLTATEADLATQTAVAADAVTERDALAALFPLGIDATLAGVDLAGDYDADITPVYCDGFSNCGAVPGFDELTIVETSQGWLRVDIDGYLDAGLYLVDGSLFTVAGSTTAAPACDATPRYAFVSLTLFASDLTVADDGRHAIDGLGASLMVQAPATATCPSGLAFHGVELTPTS